VDVTVRCPVCGDDAAPPGHHMVTPDNVATGLLAWTGVCGACHDEWAAQGWDGLCGEDLTRDRIRSQLPGARVRHAVNVLKGVVDIA